MALFDLPLAELRDYRPVIAEPENLDAFWADTLAEARGFDLDAVFERVESGVTLVDTYDVTFSGFGGHRIKGWLHVPAGTVGPLPVVVEFLGYSGGRGLAHERMSFALSGYAHLVMDTRGQGWGWTTGHTPDPTADAGLGGIPGVMTRGILDESTYYYRRLYTDAVRAIDAARASSLVDPSRVVVAGTSQGGGLAIAAAALGDDVAGALVDVPFLCHFERAVTLTDSNPYNEVVQYLRRHRDHVERVYRTLSYVDGAALASRATAPTLFSVALMDQTCAPSTVFAAYNRWAGAKSIDVYPFNDHEGGQEFHHLAKTRWLAALFSRTE
ncbi:acetylxylan esterase [Marisediminicola sp. LYQ134]|uniref:acetylxylan esterase n=1 Tax=Marisediminicola sp. LYQ134 TaxID=3391061 RepID=UPI0039831E99